MSSNLKCQKNTSHCKSTACKNLMLKFVRLKGLEPSRRKTPDPKSGASANSATSACFLKIAAKLRKIEWRTK